MTLQNLAGELPEIDKVLNLSAAYVYRWQQMESRLSHSEKIYKRLKRTK